MSRQVSVTLPTHLADELEQRVASGAYTDRSEAVTDGLRELFARELMPGCAAMWRRRMTS